ncbi:MAG: hypothetical protein P8Y23_18710 [Candidatus Lokiarchaeota archaeon]
MLAIIEEFWIFSISGDPLVHFFQTLNGEHQFNYDLPKLDPINLSEMKEVIGKISKKLRTTKKLTRLKNSEYTFVQCLKKDYIIFYKTNQNVKEKKLKKLCEMISNIFEKSYKSSQLKEIDENLKIYDKFKKTLELHFKLSTL